MFKTLVLPLALAAALVACGGNGDAPAPSHAAQVQAAAASGVASGFVGDGAGVVTPTTVDTATAGIARLDSATPVSADTRFGIGSNTKAMTAYVAARLVDRGLVQWNSRVLDVLPELRATTLPAYADVTLEQLLDHQGGLRAYTDAVDLDDFAAFLQTVTDPLPTTETGRRLFFVQHVLGQTPPDGVVPGTTFSYSNAGYALAAAMLEKVTGQSYEALFDTELTQPLGVPGAWGPSDLTGPTQPHGYYGTPGNLQAAEASDADTQRWFDVINPAGGFATTPAAYARWLQWHLKALRGAQTPLPAGYVQRLHDLAAGDYAVGWAAIAIDGRAVLAHDGAEYGFVAEAAIDQSGAAGAFVMTNTSDVTSRGGDSWVIDVQNGLVVTLERQAQAAH